MGSVKLQQIRNNSKTNRTGRQLEMNPHEAFTCKCFFFFFNLQVKSNLILDQKADNENITEIFKSAL